MIASLLKSPGLFSGSGPISIIQSFGWLKYLSFFPLSFNFTLWSAGTAKSTILQVLFFVVVVVVVDYYEVQSSGQD